MELHKSASMGEIPSPLSITSQLDEEEKNSSLSSNNSIDCDIFQSESYLFMCKRSRFSSQRSNARQLIQASESDRMKKFNIFVQTVNSIPQPHHKADMVCYVCDDVRIHQEEVTTKVPLIKNTELTHCY
ncbi:uncharacterized protein EAE97_004020 [Botrytis byssoidea]|uniref:Uncharacterized protein n=1 Tax=Botrytis byssoidea TaxID=139641 RepID=A0A9P5IU78_9HELO|nr:uncharacterized protein EAE97_004020 [Botrytis byssoidea]KAF7948609.1 hypothetical protein EAE97_004020 [Botrytis byssoidea]